MKLNTQMIIIRIVTLCSFFMVGFTLSKRSDLFTLFFLILSIVLIFIGNKYKKDTKKSNDLELKKFNVKTPSQKQNKSRKERRR